MGGSAAFAGRAETGLAQQTAEGFAAEGEALELAQFFAEVMIVEAGIGGAGQAGSQLGVCAAAGDGGWAVRGWRAPEPPPRSCESVS